MFALMSSELHRKVVLKQKRKRGTGNITGLCPLGCLVHSEKELSLCMYLKVGEGLRHEQGAKHMLVPNPENMC